MSLGSAIHSAFAGLRATQSKLAVTSDNIANANTVGYTRKSVETIANNAGSSSTSTVVSSQVQRQVDEMLRDSYWQKSSSNAFEQVVADFTKRLDDYMGKIDSESSLPKLLNNFNSSLIKLASDPKSQSNQSQVISSARTFAAELNASSAQVQSLREGAEAGVTSEVERTNLLLKDIEVLEKDIIAERASGRSVAGMNDVMDQKLGELSKYLDIDVHRDGDGELRISTVSGLTLYDVKAAQLSFSSSASLGPGAVGNPVEVVSPSGSRSSLQPADFKGGTIGGRLTLRDKVLPEAQARLDELAAQLSQSLSTNTKQGVAGDDGNSPPVKLGYKVDASGFKTSGDRIEMSFTDAHGNARDVTFVAVSDPSLLPLDGRATAKADDIVYGIDISAGAASLQSQVASALGASFEVSAPASGELQIFADTGATSAKLTSLMVKSTQTTARQSGLALPVFYDSENGGTPYSGALENGGQKVGYAKRITINDALLSNPGLLEGQDPSGSGADQARAQFLTEAISSTRIDFDPQSGIGGQGAPYHGTIADFANEVISKQGQVATSAKSALTSAKTALSLSQKAYESSYKVDVDTELVNLMQLQNAYSANARVLNASNKLFEQLMALVR